jgi:putative sigma-54 modulation protein
MRYSFTGKNMNVSDALKDKTQNKLKRMEKLFPQDCEAHITFTTNRYNAKTEVTIPMHKRVLRAEVSAADINTSLDSVVDILEKQVIKYKTQLRDRRRRHTATPEEVSFIEAAPATETVDESGEIIIQKVKRFALKPMDAQEAVLEMEMLGHDFFVFRNSVNHDVNVVYKRKDGEYGLIEPIE